MKALSIIFLILCSALYGSWAEDTLKTLSREEKVGQLFVISISPPRGDQHLQHIKAFMEKYPVGGILFKQAHPVEQISFLNAIQEISPLPLLTLADAEWGLGMRMKKTLSYPRNLTLGAVQDMDLLVEVGRQIGEQCRLVGSHINIAPVVDVNTNPENPVIHRRALGDDPLEVSKRGIGLLQGMQGAGLFACIKHFPGHGDTSVDSHHDLPIVPHGCERISQVELVPFKQAIDAGVECVLTAHLLIPALDTVPCTFSKPIVTDLLQKKLGFEGLVITDALNMKALTNYFSAGEIGLKACLAGHHLLLYGSHKDEVVDAILNEWVPAAFEMVLNSDIPDLDAKVLRILKIKERLGLHKQRYTPLPDNLMEQLHDSAYTRLITRLFEEAVTLYRDEGLPASHEKIAYVQIGKEESTPFFTDLQEAFDVTYFHYGKELNLEGFDRVILALYETSLPEELRQLDAMTLVFTTPYAVQTCPKSGTIIVGYEAVREAEKAVLKVLKGELKTKGKLPVSFPSE